MLCCRPPRSSSPEALPLAVGANVAVNFVFAPALIEVGCKVIVYPAPEIVAAVMFNVAFPVLVSVTVLLELLPTFTLPNATGDGLILSCACAALAIVSVSLALPVPALFVALSITVDVPAAVGVPEITPVLLLTPRPAGNPVAA